MSTELQPREVLWYFGDNNVERVEFLKLDNKSMRVQFDNGQVAWVAKSLTRHTEASAARALKQLYSKRIQKAYYAITRWQNILAKDELNLSKLVEEYG